jgi:hypothetical protein
MKPASFSSIAHQQEDEGKLKGTYDPCRIELNRLAFSFSSVADSFFFLPQPLLAIKADAFYNRIRFPKTL